MEKPNINAAAAAAITPIILRTMLFSGEVPSKFNTSQFYKILRIFQNIVVSTFLLFFSLIETLIAHPPLHTIPSIPSRDPHALDSSISRALSQILCVVTDVPVGSRKYNSVRSLADDLIDDNHREGLRDLNRRALSRAFDRIVQNLEDVVDREARSRGASEFCLGRVLRLGESVLKRFSGDWRRPCQYSGDKLAAELIWLGRKMKECGVVEEAVGCWSMASRLASMVLDADPRVQGSLVKLSAFLIKHANKSVESEFDDDYERKKTNVNMLISWVPLLCRASNGMDAHTLSLSERAEIERVLEGMIEKMSDDEQERVLSIWLHHFTHCSDSDWPNLQPAYVRWYSASRKLHLLQ